MSAPSGLPDLRHPHVVDLPVGDDGLTSLDALVAAIPRLDPERVQHHLGDLPLVSPEGETEALDLTPEEVALGLATNGCWLLAAGLGQLPEYRPLLDRVAGPWVQALQRAGHTPLGRDLNVILGAPGATVPVHFDRRHHVLVQVQGTKTAGTGRFDDPQVQQVQLEEGLGDHPRNADRLPDRREEHRLQPGQALVIPAFTFHWVRGGDEVSISLVGVVTTRETQRATAVHRFNRQVRALGLRPAAPGHRRDRAKAAAVHTLDRWRTRHH